MTKPARKRQAHRGRGELLSKPASANASRTAAKPGKRAKPRDTHRSKGLRTISIAPRLPKRRRDAHKGSFGRLLVIGGSRGMIGAPALVANAGLRSGAGLATVACPGSIQLAVAGLCPCATTIPLPENAAGMLDPRRSLRLLRGLGLLGGDSAPSVVAAGPGLGRGHEGFDRAWHALLAAFGEAGVPLVVDADGLNAMHRSSAWKGPGWDERQHFRTIITPHPGEMAGLYGVSAATVQADRRGFAVRTAALMSAGTRDPDYRAVVVLKGAGTLVTDGVNLYRNKTGNPGMATGGSGDVLTGVIAALIAQGMNTMDAAVLGVHAHGLAGDLAVKDIGETALIAADLIDYLPVAFKQPRRS